VGVCDLGPKNKKAEKSGNQRYRGAVKGKLKSQKQGKNGAREKKDQGKKPK